MSARQEAIASELLALQNERGLIVPKHVVSWAKRNKRSMIYQKLEWNDEVAGAAYRENQVRLLIAVHIEEHGARRFVSLSVDRVEGGGYRELPSVMNRTELRTIMLEDALHELERVQRKYETLKELEIIWDAAKEVRRRKKK